MQTCRSLYRCPASIFQKGRLPPRGSCHLLPAAAQVGMAGFITHWAVTRLCILINHVQPGAGSWFYQYRQSRPPAVLCCSEARLLLRKGTGMFPSIFPLSNHPGLWKGPEGPLLFNNFSAFHNPPYHAASSCARALAAARGNAQPWHYVFCG